MRISSDDFRRVGRYAAQTRRANEARRRVEAAEDAVTAAEAAWHATGTDEAYAALKAAQAALYEIDPKNGYFL